MTFFTRSSAAMRRTGRRPERGFTLIELLVGMGRFILLLGTISAIFTTFVRQHRTQLRREALAQEVQSFFEQLDREVRTAFGDTFQVPAPGQFFLVNQDHACVKYGLTVDKRVVRASVTSALCGEADVNLPGTGERFTSRSTRIEQLAFDFIHTPVVGWDDPATPGGGSEDRDILTGQQGRLTVSVLACPAGGEPKEKDCIPFQTTMTTRQYDPCIRPDASGTPTLCRQ